MDAPDQDQDIWIQKSSATLLSDFADSIEPFLWEENGEIKQTVRIMETDRLISLLEPFQELPQLLDPYLANFVTTLSTAFLSSIRKGRPQTADLEHSSIPSSIAICKLLYTLCKIRGDKVIVHFFSTEARYLEFLLDAIEDVQNHTMGSNLAAEEQKIEDPQAPQAPEALEPWTWEVRYITLLWLSQLLLAPFDLATISSDVQFAQVQIPHFQWPEKVPTITSRIIPLAIQYLEMSSKESDAAKVLLVRVAGRKDMIQLGIFSALLSWAISYLQALRTNVTGSNVYQYIGVLSFLTGLFVSGAKTNDMDPYIESIARHFAEDIIDSEFGTMVASRKLTIKALRALSVLFLRPQYITSGPHEFVTYSIDYLLTALSDSSTPVRLAASKALSIIILNINAQFAAQYFDVVTQCLDVVIEMFYAQVKVDQVSNVADTSTVNSSEWHGLILTMSQLLYRRLPISENFTRISSTLIRGLSFEQRTTTGSSIGTNVRDAACFGIWSLARRYSTAELSSITQLSTPATILTPSSCEISLFQNFATHLVVSATMDPSGNIRRGSSAALQELIGRHPDTVAEGIPLVQVVDYHAIALRSKAITDVAFQASNLSNQYMIGILDAMHGWRGIGDADAASRRIVATTYGNIICNVANSEQRQSAYDALKDQFNTLKARDDDKRHGLILCVASILNHGGSLHNEHAGYSISKLRELITLILSYARTATHRRIELIAEAVSRLVEAAAARTVNSLGMSTSIEPLFTKAMILEANNSLFSKWLLRNEPEVIDATSDAASTMLQLMCSEKESQEAIITDWIFKLAMKKSGGQNRQDIGVLATLLKSFGTVQSMQSQIVSAIHHRWHNEHDIDIRVAILKSLISSAALETHALQFADMISEGMDDYTTTARGDVGSLVRIEAVKAAGTVWATLLHEPEIKEPFMRIYGKGLRLAAEKLDKVRSAAQSAISGLLVSNKFRNYATTSEQYFRFLLDMQTMDCLLPGFVYQAHFGQEMLEGYVGSADTGSESLVRASRAALADYCEAGNIDLVTTSLNNILKDNIKNERILVPTLEVLGFLFDAGIIQRSKINYKSLCLTVHKAHLKSSNIRKLEAAVRLYGAMAEGGSPESLDRLTKMVLHPFPKIRMEAIDTLFVTTGMGKGINWLKAGKKELTLLREQLGIPAI